VRPLAIGAMVRADDVKVVKISAANFPSGGISNVEEVVDRPVISNILMDEPIHQGRLAPRGSGAGLAPVIPEGMRALSIKVNEVVGVSGFVLPGMRVDVLLTGSPPDDSDRMTATILQNVLVLSSGQQMEADAQGRAMNVRTVTVLVTPEEAEKLTLATNRGQVQLVLRNGSDQTIAETDGAQEGELYGRRRKPEPRPAPPVQTAVAQAAPPPPPPPPPPDRIEIFRGSQRSVQVLNTGSNQ